MIWQSDAVHGAKPAYLHLPPLTSTAGDEAIDLAATAGLVLDPWQRFVLLGACGERPDGRWAARSVVIVVPRQNGKGSILEARELAGLFLFGSRLIIHSAHEFKTAAEAFRRILELIESTPELDAQVMRVTRSHGDEGIELRNKSRLRFMARSKGAGRGFGADDVIVDEAYDFLDVQLDAILPTLSARDNPQLWFTSSAPFDDERSSVLRRFMRAGRKGTDDNLAYFEWCADDDADTGSERAWGEANPGYPHRITDEAIGQELALQGVDGFRRERLGVVDLREATRQTLLDVQVWESLTVRDAIPGDPPSFALDISPDRQWSSFVVAAPGVEDRVHVELVDRRPRTGWVVPRALELWQRWQVPLAISAGSPASALATELETAGVPLVEVSNAANARACSIFLDMVNDARIVHRGDLPLRDAIQNAYPRDYGDMWMWSRRKATGVDISPLIAATLAVWVQIQPKPEEPVPVTLVTL